MTKQKINSSKLSKSNKILILYGSVMPYTFAVIRELQNLQYEIHVITKLKDPGLPYIPPNLDNVYYYEYYEYDNDPKKLFNLINKINPDLIHSIGWMFKHYNYVLKKYKRRREIPIVAGCDTQWHGSHQWINALLSKFRHKKWFSHILVSGQNQFEYAKKLGFSNNQILKPFYSADNELFRLNYIPFNSRSKTLLFVGRFVEIKGVKNLINAWKSIENLQGWKLKLIGEGNLKSLIPKDENIEIINFLAQKELAKEMNNAKCFILPSTFEPWALVIHEAVCSGLPILSSDKVGANSEFLIDGFNGFSFDPVQSNNIKDAILKIMNLNDDKLLEFSNNSLMLSNRINPKIAATALVSPISK